MENTLSVWNRFSEHLKAFIARRVGQSSDVDDLLQEVFLKIHLKLTSLKDERKLQSWVFQIARNVLNDYYRSSTNSTKEREAAGWWNSEAGNSFEELQGCLLPFIEQLPPKYKEALTLSELQGLKQTEVATMLGISYSGAKSRIQRGRELLKQKFMDCCHFTLDDEGRLVGDFRSRSKCSSC